MWLNFVCVAKRTLEVSGNQTGIITPFTRNFPTAGKAGCHFMTCKWHWQEADRTILFRRWLFEQGLVMQFGGALLAFFFVPRPVPPLTSHAAIVDVLARIAHLEASAALAALGTLCHRI
jgi:hypothetical protein